MDSFTVDDGVPLFFVLVHGLDGNIEDFTPFKEVIVEKFKDKAKVLISVSNSETMRSTYYGVEVLGNKLADEILDFMGKHYFSVKHKLIGPSFLSIRFE